MQHDAASDSDAAFYNAKNIDFPLKINGLRGVWNGKKMYNTMND